MQISRTPEIVIADAKNGMTKPCIFDIVCMVLGKTVAERRSPRKTRPRAYVLLPISGIST
eukprot:13475688-Alexandrium_andersonii.AAC.1